MGVSFLANADCLLATDAKESLIHSQKILKVIQRSGQHTWNFKELEYHMARPGGREVEKWSNTRTTAHFRIPDRHVVVAAKIWTLW